MIYLYANGADFQRIRTVARFFSSFPAETDDFVIFYLLQQDVQRFPQQGWHLRQQLQLFPAELFEQPLYVELLTALLQPQLFEQLFELLLLKRHIFSPPLLCNEYPLLLL